MSIADNAQQYHAVGLSVLPARRLEKRPAIPSWKEFQKHLPTANHVAAWFANAHDALCVICGQVSGNLEVLDFDNQGELFDAWLDAIPQVICDRLVVEQTPSGGYHVAYRCPEGISGNLKLAAGLRDGKRMTLIETRGEGGLVLCAPTEGYELLQGDYARLGALSGNERITLLDAAWRLNELVEENKAEKQTGEDTRFTTRPGDDYNARGDFPALLQAHGWAYLRTMPDGNQHWRRPGKDGDYTSATLKDGSFYVFSSNATPFEPGHGYSAFGACALLEHGGDHAKAAAELAKQGYGTAAEEHPGVDLSGLLGPSGKPLVHQADPAIAKPKGNRSAPITPIEQSSDATDDRTVLTAVPFPEELFNVPGLVSDVMQFSLDTAPSPNRMTAFVGALALQAHLAARKVQAPGGARTNPYLVVLAKSGYGKDHPRKINRTILRALNRSKEVIDGVASGQALEDRLLVTPAILWQSDEFYAVLLEVVNDKTGQKENLMKTLLSLFTSANVEYEARAKVGRDPATINCPNLVLMGSCTPGNFSKTMNDGLLAHGMYSRMAVFPVPKIGGVNLPKDISVVPEHIIARAKKWVDYVPPGSGNMDFKARTLYAADTTMQRMLEIMLEARARLDALDDVGAEDWKLSIWTRAFESIMRFSLIYACSKATSPDEAVLDMDALEWARKFVFWEAENKIAFTDQNYYQSDFERYSEEVIAILTLWKRANADKPMPGWKFNRRTKKLPPKMLNAVLQSLTLQERINVEQINNNGKTGLAYSLKR
jgi:hypothetical protein